MSNALKLTSSYDEQYFERTQRNQFFIGGEKGQEEIRKLKIGIAGLGGMGSNIAEYLARLGVGSLKLADPDTIDMSNLNRQVIANQKTVGTKKAIASRDEILNIAPDINLSLFEEGIIEENVDDFVRGCDFVVDEIDVFPIEAHYILHRKCREYNVPVYSSYVIGLGIHFYKFLGDEFKFEDLIQVHGDESDEQLLDKIVDSFVTNPPKYLNESNLENFKKMSAEKGVPIFGPSCLVGHSIVVTRILCDFLGSEILGQKVATTPVMPEYLKIDFTTLEIKVENIIKK